MPPKRTKGPKQASTSIEGNANGEPKIDEPANGAPTTPDKPDASPKPIGDNDSDSSDLNEEDSFKILKKILLNQKIAEKKSDERFAKLNKSIKDSKKALDAYKDTNDKSVASVKSSVQTTINDLKDLKKKVTGLQEKLEETNEKLDTTQKKLDDTRDELKVKGKVLEKLEKKYDRDEEELKRCLLLIDGVNERDNKRPMAVIEALLKDLDINFKENDVKSAYRLGTMKSGIARPRTIKVQFNNTAMKGEIFKNIGKLKQLDAWRGAHLNDALSPKEQMQVKDLRCIYAVGKARGLDIKLRGSILIIDGIKLTYNNIDNLPYDLSMESAKTIQVKDGYAFQSHHSFLSNMFLTDIRYEGEIYKSAEHLYTAEFIKHHDKLDILQDVLDAEDGYAAKRLIRNIKAKDTWDNVKYKIMEKIISLKFDQNDSIRDKLLAKTGFLYEATKDVDFGCGLTLGQNKDINQENIKGKNMLGILLCKYRDNILG